MSLKGYVEELNQINLEIKRNNIINKKLRTRGKELEDLIKGYLQEKNQNGLKYKGQAILLENKEKRTNKTKKEKVEDTINLLHSLGVSNAEDAYNQLQEVQKGSTIEHTKLRFTKINNNRI